MGQVPTIRSPAGTTDVEAVGRALTRRIAGTVAVAAAAFTAVTALLPTSLWWVGDLVLLAAALAAAAVCLDRPRHHPDEPRLTWMLVGAACGAWAVGMAAWSGLQLLGGGRVTFPSVADAGFAVSLPLAAAAVLSLPAVSGLGLRLRSLFEGALAASGTLFATWAFVTLRQPELVESGIGTRLALGYPVAYGFVAGMALFVASRFVVGRRGPLCLVGAGFLVIGMVNLPHAVLLVEGTYTSGEVVGAGWLAGFVLIALGGGHREGVASGTRDPGKLALLAPYLPLVVAVVVLSWRQVLGLAADPVLVVIGGVTATLVVARQFLALVDNHSLARSLEARVSERTAELALLAASDDLTGLPNRSSLRAELQARLSSDDSRLALLLIDLDGFKDVNDSLGHSTGDRLLVEVARKVSGALRRDDVVARLGGDEFAVLLSGIADAEEASTVAQHLIDAIARPIEMDGICLRIGASVGVVLAPEHGTEPELLLRRADSAMYRAKGRGASWAVHTDEGAHDGALRLALAADLRATLDAEELDLWFQPQIDLQTGQVTGVEALARWTHPVRGPVSPAEFIPLAEQTGLIRQLTPLVLRRALWNARRWSDEGVGVPVAVNLPAVALSDSDTVRMVSLALHETGVPSSGLTLEITESALAEPTPAVFETLSALRALGVRLSVDDFGTGYSSLAYLKRLPVNEIKLDRAFVSHLDTDQRDRLIARAVIDLSRGLGLAIIAEGVETKEVSDELARLGCHIGQGYLYCRPVPPAELLGWLNGRIRLQLRPGLGELSGWPERPKVHQLGGR